MLVPWEIMTFISFLIVWGSGEVQMEYLFDSLVMQQSSES